MEEKQWFLYVVDHHEGPFNADEIKKLVQNGAATQSSYVWKEGLTDWMVMSEVAEFGESISQIETPLSQEIVPKETTPQKEIVSFEVQPKVVMPQAQEPVANVTAVHPSDSVWCLNSNKIFSGPFSMQTILRKINEGEVSLQDFVWKEGWTNFISIQNIPEFMQQIKQDKKTMEISKVETKHRARFIKYFIFLLIVVVVAYQLFSKTGMIAKVKSWNLRSLSIPELSSILHFSSLKLPKEIAAPQAKILQEVASHPLKQGARVATALTTGDELNPSFVVVSNMPDQAQFEIFLLGKEGTLLSGTGYQGHSIIQIKDHIGRTDRFYFEDNKPLPKGSYLLVVYESNNQQSQAASVALAGFSKKTVPPFIPADKVAYATDSYFLGGLQDQLYVERLKEVNQRVKMRRTQELVDLSQMANTLESMANESAAKFFVLTKAKLGSKQQFEWEKYHLKYVQMSGQMKEIMAKAQMDMDRKEYLLPTLFEKVRQTYALSENLHGAETGFVINPSSVTLDDIRKQATQMVAALHDLKSMLAEANR